MPEKTRFRGFFRWSQKPGQAGLQTVDKALSTVFRFSALQRREHHVPVRKAHGRNMIAEAACSRSSRRTRRRCGLYLEGCGPPSLPKGFSAEAACCRSRRAEAGHRERGKTRRSPRRARKARPAQQAESRTSAPHPASAGGRCARIGAQDYKALPAARKPRRCLCLSVPCAPPGHKPCGGHARHGDQQPGSGQRNRAVYAGRGQGFSAFHGVCHGEAVRLIPFDAHTDKHPFAREAVPVAAGNV